VGDPILTIVSVLAIVVLVPVIEELLFRGFLQSWLVSRFTPFTSIALSSAIFTMVHFSPSQGIANAELMTGLFLLALFLGYLYQRQGSLWASIGLHCTFNAVSVTMILMGVGS
jgi:membrane protease YdiL (CAAX protease family)